MFVRRHAATAIGGQWTGSYDAAGDLTCRAPSSSTTCAGTVTGALFTADAEGRLAAWQNTPTNPTTTDGFLYDGAGQRVEQQVTTGGSTTTSVYVGNLAEYTITTSTGWIRFYTFAGLMVAARANYWHYLLHDQVNSIQVQVGSGGTAEAVSLRRPYGTTRYGSSSFMGDLGFTNQRKDSTPNLVYFNARYYDQEVGVFTSADTVLSGLNRYAYVGGNPTRYTDPTGHHMCEDDSCTGISESVQNGPGYSTEQRNLIRQVLATFNDQRTRRLLLTLVNSPTGTQFLESLVQAGQDFGGDNYITWKKDSSPGAYTDSNGHIQLNTGLLTADVDPGGAVAYYTAAGDEVFKTDRVTAAAGALVHEAVESYFALEDGLVFPASQAMDYVAQWFGGKVVSELNASLNTGAPGSKAWDDRQSFTTWKASPDDGYQNEDKTEPWWHSVGGVLVLWWKDDFLPLLPGPVGLNQSMSLLPNPMGLNQSMLTSGCVAAPCW